MTNIFEALRADHQVQRSLIEELVATVGASDERKELFARLRAELRGHAAAEERHFYVPLMQEDLTQDKARHSIAEHKEIDELVVKLEEYELDASQWLTTARQLRHDVTHHLDEEEAEVFQLAGKVLSDDEKSTLATSYEQEMANEREEA